MKVLLVDDSAPVRERLLELLGETEGVEVVGQAGTIAEGLIGLRQLRPDFVILDLRMPDGDGASLLRAAKALDPIPQVAVLTNYPDEYHRRHCLAGGADFFWDKAKDSALIRPTLEACVRGRVAGAPPPLAALPEEPPDP